MKELEGMQSAMQTVFSPIAALMNNKGTMSPPVAKRPVGRPRGRGRGRG